ncbi:hypothetical protein QBC40DRAFT_294646 [Triangularia verruculosa]|uniref:DUF1763-domain-containing protein n=1 Tax=Triangularia verruculosa TaxID=2587418 RepID=A0AAN7AVE4_9PEZI|nr:hypothetical protein QBC40DRAFT_294646 [Triangularia verruculosa]
MATIPTKTELLTSYRHLYRAALQAVQYSKPSRYVVRDQLRLAFRDAKNLAEYHPEKIRRTIWFFHAASQSRGLEHRICKTLVRMHWERARQTRRTWRQLQRERGEAEKASEKTKRKMAGRGVDVVREGGLRWRGYEGVVRMFGESMGLCLR